MLFVYKPKIAIQKYDTEMKNHVTGSIPKKWKTKNATLPETVPKYNRKIAETVKIDNPNTHIHEGAYSWLGTGTSIKSGGIIPILWTQNHYEKRYF